MPPARGAGKYQEGEPVLCFQVFLSSSTIQLKELSKDVFLPCTFQGGLIYEAKVQALQKEEGATLYRIHYKVTFSLDLPFVGY